MRLLPLMLVAASCAPTIPILLPSTVGVPASIRADTPEVSACLLVAEHYARPLWNGVERDEGKTWDYMIGSVLVRHPKAVLVIDPTFATTVGADLDRAGGVAKALLGDGTTKTSLKTLLERARVDASTVTMAVATHAHWDHVGGMDALPAATLWLPKVEVGFTCGLTDFFDHGVMTGYLQAVSSRTTSFEFDDAGEAGFSATHDFFDDGTLVAAPLPGHTPGSTAFLLRANGRRFLFSGDATWTYRGVEAPAHKHGLVRSVDHDVEVNSGSIALLHALSLYRPDLTIVPAHDGARMSLLPRCDAP